MPLLHQQTRLIPLEGFPGLTVRARVTADLTVISVEGWRANFWLEVQVERAYPHHIRDALWVGEGRASTPTLADFSLGGFRRLQTLLAAALLWLEAHKDA